jgi:hypothetical protein
MLGSMAIKRIPDDDGMSALRAHRSGDRSRTVVATSVRFLLQVLADRAPGHTVEMRVPPFGAVQCVEGPRHTRGTPPNVIECDPETWIALALGGLEWREAMSEARVAASGQRANLAGLLPVLRLRD